MHLRTFTRRDLPDVATITADCNAKDVLSRYTIRNIDTEYTSYRLAEYAFLRRMWNEPGRQSFVLVSNPDDVKTKLQSSESLETTSTTRADNEVILGWAWFSRKGTSEIAKQWQASTHNSLSDKIDRSLITLEDYLMWFVPKPGVNRPHRATINAHKTPELDKLYPAEYWSVDGMMVAPEYQRQGCGKALLDWVFARAREENVPVVVDGSPRGGLFYRKYGFESIGEIGFHAYFDETEMGGERHQRWIWIP